ncbi:hypothetical protein Scep_022148 [Stephania cephalantha]|uniref:Uncharacterized protein n=1 Tax=Stephania cephalantha TaxID=152367 RepID=A0AAP0F5L2_9MAGN
MERVRDWRRKGWTAERGGGPATRKDDDGPPAHGGNSSGDTADGCCARQRSMAWTIGAENERRSSGLRGEEMDSRGGGVAARSRHRPPRRRPQRRLRRARVGRWSGSARKRRADRRKRADAAHGSG